MKILACHPGRFGDLLWALPSARALHAAGHEVDLLIPETYQGIKDLVEAQPYVGRVFIATQEQWPIQQTAPITPILPFNGAPFKNYHTTISLAYRTWPERPLPYCTYSTVQKEGLEIGPLSLDPWIQIEGPGYPADLVCGFSDEWFELKLGIATLTESALQYQAVQTAVAGLHTRWSTETPAGTIAMQRNCGWVATAQMLRNANVFLGCCSALHVLAIALGKPCVIVEPNPQRWNDIFWPLGKTGGGVELVTGLDGLPTFDARHTIDKVREVISAVSR